MFSALGALIMLFTTYNVARETTKLEIEYRCKTYHEAPLASKYVTCKEGEDLPWVKDLRKRMKKK